MSIRQNLLPRDSIVKGRLSSDLAECIDDSRNMPGKYAGVVGNFTTVVDS